MPAPVIELPVEESSAGRRIYKDEAEEALNVAFAQLFDTIAAIPAGPVGERGPVGAQGERWVIGTPREYAVGLACVVGNVIYRRYAGTSVTALFRCLQATTTSDANFPSSAVSNAAWELLLIVPWGERGLQGIQGIQGPTGATGTSANVVQFDTDAEAIAHSTAHPLDFVISIEGVA